MKKFLFMISMLIMFIPSAYAKEINHFYADASNNINFSDDVNGTSIIAGNNVDTTGTVYGPNFIFANEIKDTGTSDYLITAGNNITIDGVVENDAFIAGNLINIKDKSKFDRDVFIMGSDIEINSSIDRNATIYGGKVNIKNSNIKGNIRIYATEIKIDEKSVIAGELTYPEDAKVDIKGNVKSIKKVSPIQTKEETLFTVFINKVWSFMALVLVFAVITLCAPKIFEKIQNMYSKTSASKCAATITKGLALLILVPTIAMIILLLPFGAPLTLILTALYFIAIYISQIFTGYFVGYKLWQKYINSDINILIVGIFGLAIMFILSLIPIVNIFVILFSLFFGIGVIYECLTEKS